MQKIILISALCLLIYLPGFSYKKDIDVQLLSDIVSQKQDEIRDRILKDLMMRNIKTANNATFGTLYNMLDVLLTQKNKAIISRELIQQMANYGIAYKIADDFIKSKKPLHIGERGIDRQKQNEGLKLMINKGQSNAEVQNSTYLKNFKAEDKEYAKKANYILDYFYTKLGENKTLKDMGLFKRNYRFEVNYFTYEENQIALNAEMDSYLAALDLDAHGEQMKNVCKAGIKLGTGEIMAITVGEIKNILKLFNDAVEPYVDVSKFYNVYKLGKIIQQYVILNLSDQEKLSSVFKDFSIDVESIILSLEDAFVNKRTPIAKHKVGIIPFFTIGLNTGIFWGDSNKYYYDESSSTYSNLRVLGFASEKIGFKFIFRDFKYTRSFKPDEWFLYRGKYRRWAAPQKQKLVAKTYGMLYGSGILYNIVDAKTNKKFNNYIAGAGCGITFFNDLDVNLSIAFPLSQKDNLQTIADKGFINFGFDVPILTYLQALTNKK